MPEESKSIIWYDDDGRGVYADMSSVASTRDEISLLFGVSRMSASENDEIRMKLKERIVISPLAAKRFSLVLRHALKKYESDIRMSKPDRIFEKTGAIDESPVFPINSRENTKVDLLLGILRRLNLKYGLERSFKIAHKKINENRFYWDLGRMPSNQSPLKRSGMSVGGWICRKIMKYHDCSKYHHMMDIGGNSGEFVLLIFERSPIEAGETQLPYSSMPFLIFSHFYRSSKIYEKILECIGYQDIIAQNIDLGWPFFLVSARRI